MQIIKCNFWKQEVFLPVTLFIRLSNQLTLVNVETDAQRAKIVRLLRFTKAETQEEVT